MKNVKNLIEKEGLINTFNTKYRTRLYSHKKYTKKYFYVLIRYKCVILHKNIIKTGSVSSLYNNDTNQFNLKIQNCSFVKTIGFLFLFFIKIIFIKSFKPITSTLRFKKSIFKFKYTKTPTSISYFVKNNAGRNNKGRITVYSKGTSIKKRNVITTTNNNWSSTLNILFGVIRSGRKIFSLRKHTTGSFSTTPHIDGTVCGQLSFFAGLPKKYWQNNLPGNYTYLKFLTRYSIVSNINTGSKLALATANGTFCQVLDVFYDFNLVKLILPSKKTIFLSGNHQTLLGKNAQKDYRFIVFGKAGTLLLKKKKPKVRGVARNPVDHPHGGRTKTNQPEVSIWGWVAKKNK